LKPATGWPTLAPLPDLVLNEIAQIAQRDLDLKVAVTVFDENGTRLKTIIPDSLTDAWWITKLAKNQITRSELRNLFSGATPISQSYLIDPDKEQFPALLNGPGPTRHHKTKKALIPLLAIPLDARGGRATGVLWVDEIGPAPTTGTIQRLEIFANQIAGAIESTKLFSRQVNQLRIRNTLVNAGQRIATVLDHKEVANTVLDAVIRIIPSVELAVIYFRTSLDTDLTTVGLTSRHETVDTAPIEPGLITTAFVDKKTIYKAAWKTTKNGPDKSLLIEPLTITSVPLGALAVISHQPDALSTDYHQILTILANQAAIALQNASLYAEAQRVDEIEALYEAGKAIDSTLNLQETLTTTMAVSRSLTGASISNVYLYTIDGQRIDSVVTLSDDIALTDADRRSAAKIARDVVEGNNPKLVIQPQSSPAASVATGPDEATFQTIQDWLAVPLPGTGHPMGVLELGSERSAAFSANDVRLMQIIASHAATAVEKARLYEEIQQRLQQTEALNTISQSISTTLQLERVLELVVQSAAKTIPVATHSTLYLLGQKGTPLEPEAQISTKGTPLPTEILEFRKGIVQQTIQESATVRVTQSTEKYGAWSLLVAPLRVGESVIGAISVNSPRPDAFHSSDETLLNTFASHASIAIQNANLFQDLSTAYKDLSSKQEEILRSHSTLQALFNGITDGMYIITRQLEIVTINQAEAKRLNTTPETLIGQKCNESLWGDATTAIAKLVQTTFDTGREGIWESRIDIGNRSLFTDRDVHTYPIFGLANTVTQVIIFAQDVSEKRRLQASLFRSANMAAVGQLASSVAHQINNPLTVIIANAQIMGMDADPDSSDYAVIQYIEEAGTHIRKIVQNLLDFSTQDSYEWFETDIEETIEDALTLVTHSLRKSDIKVIKQINELPAIIASGSHLKLLWMNLLLNAREAIEESQQAGIIEISGQRINPDTVQIQLVDNGIGIPVRYRDRLFHPFFTTKAGGKHLGLGLFTCGAIVEFHRGKIELDNNPESPGTVVTVTLPVGADNAVN